MERSRRFALILGTSAVILLLGATVLLSIWRRSVAQEMDRAHLPGARRLPTEAISGLATAESAQRGYLLTGLDPVSRQLRRRARGLRLGHDPARTPDRRQPGPAAAAGHAQDLGAERRREVPWRRRSGCESRRGLDAATGMFQTGLGRQMMDSVRTGGRRPGQKPSGRSWPSVRRQRLGGRGASISLRGSACWPGWRWRWFRAGPLPGAHRAADAERGAGRPGPPAGGGRRPSWR